MICLKANPIKRVKTLLVIQTGFYIIEVHIIPESMRYFTLTLLITLMSILSINAQIRERPPMGTPGKCYAKCLVKMESDTVMIEYPVYVGENPKKSIVRNIRHEVVPAKTKWVKKPDPNCRSAKPEDCLMLCLEEISPAQYIDLVVAKKPKKHDVKDIEYQQYPQIRPQTNVTDWREVLCENQINKSLIKQMRNKLFMMGYDLAEGKAVLDSKLRAALTDYQKKNDLPIGQLDLESLDALGIKY